MILSQDQLELCLQMLKNASPTEEDDEEETIRSMEEGCRQMGVLIEKKVVKPQIHTLSSLVKPLNRNRHGVVKCPA